MAALILNPLARYIGLGAAITIALLTAALGITRNTLHNVRQAYKLEAARNAEIIARAAAKHQADLAKASDDYAARLADREPIILHSKDTVTRYAQTDAGRKPCLDVDRVRGIEALDSALASPATSSTSAVPRATPDAPR